MTRETTHTEDRGRDEGGLITPQTNHNLCRESCPGPSVVGKESQPMMAGLVIVTRRSVQWIREKEGSSGADRVRERIARMIDGCLCPQFNAIFSIHSIHSVQYSPSASDCDLLLIVSPRRCEGILSIPPRVSALGPSPMH